MTKHGTSRNGNWFKAARLTVILCLAAAVLVAQSYQGGVRGTVQDVQNAAIAKAEVTLTNDGTGEARSTADQQRGGI